MSPRGVKRETIKTSDSEGLIRIRLKSAAYKFLHNTFLAFFLPCTLSVWRIRIQRIRINTGSGSDFCLFKVQYLHRKKRITVLDLITWKRK